ncbi:MAG: tRNA 4-thiouridine(8) synthase ThiI [Desulfobacterales bacterium]|nr:tRNA 4-thiouridine(8) synthase ThiI [Desulfobacterales bacterium]MBF0397040.1 tRNA 4-thiouridine(8) synthase ThiI [Desulfobacterales bacterium]
MIERKLVKALGLSSGGLDSILSALVLRKQGIDVEWVSFETPFFSSSNAKKAADTLSIPIVTPNITNIYLDMLKNPNCGYGKNMNPCLDCHALMFKLASEIMWEKKYDFLFSGEVLGQRPMSQTKPSLRYVEKKSGIPGYILRPLSAKRLPETIVEQKGLVKRELLLDLIGRSRKPQMKLAKEFGVTDYPQPAGGCLLTYKSYADRLKDLFKYRDTYTEKELQLLKYGRHIRLNPDTKIVVGRDEKDNVNIINCYEKKTDVFIKIKDFPGPIVLVSNNISKEDITIAARLSIGYSKLPKDKNFDLSVTVQNKNEILNLTGISTEIFKDLYV